MVKTADTPALNLKMLDKKVDKYIQSVVNRYEDSNKIIQFFVFVYLSLYYFGYNWIVRIAIKFINSKNAKVIVILLIAAVLVTIGVIKVYAFYNSFGEKDLGRYKYYTTYTVHGGDTIWSIASDMVKVNPEYNSIRAYGSEIMLINDCGENIKAGQELTLPYYSTNKEQQEIIKKYIMSD